MQHAGALQIGDVLRLAHDFLAILELGNRAADGDAFRHFRLVGHGASSAAAASTASTILR